MKLISKSSWIIQTHSEWNPGDIWQCSVGCKCPDGLSKFDCKYWQLCPVPCLTSLIHLPLPLTGPFQSMLLFFRSFFICPLEAAPPPHLLSVSMSRVTSMDRCPYFRLLLYLWPRLCPVFDGLGLWDFSMHKETYAGGRDRLFPHQKKSLHHPRTEDTSSCVYRQCSLWKPLTSYREKFSFQTFLTVADSETHNALLFTMSEFYWYG